MSSAPAPPDPYATAAAQTQSNQQTASYNAALNRVSSYTPYGNQVYSQTGTDSTGAPMWRSDITLDPRAQEQLDNQLRQNTQLSKLGDTLAGQTATQIGTPYSDQAQSADAASKAYYDNKMRFIQPQLQQDQSNLDSRLANQGVMQGSDAYGRAQNDMARVRISTLDQAQNDAIQQGQSQQAIALQNQSALKNAPLNQLNALRTGTQIQNPTFTQAPQSSAAGTDISGDIYKSNALQAANANNFNNGLFSLGSSAAMAFSDSRLKRDIERIGETPLMKLPLYAFRYLWDDILHVGVMAQDVLLVKPEAVTVHGGYMAVNYSALA